MLLKQPYMESFFDTDVNPKCFSCLEQTKLLPQSFLEKKMLKDEKYQKHGGAFPPLRSAGKCQIEALVE